MPKLGARAPPLTQCCVPAGVTRGSGLSALPCSLGGAPLPSFSFLFASRKYPRLRQALVYHHKPVPPCWGAAHWVPRLPGAP